MRQTPVATDRLQANALERRSTSQTLSYVVAILLIITLGATCFLVLVMEPKLKSANKLCQTTSSTESRLWKISDLSDKLTTASDPISRRQIIKELLNEKRLLTKELSDLSGDLPNSGPISDNMAKAYDEWNRVSLHLNTLVSEQSVTLQGKTLSFESDISPILMSLSTVTDMLADRTDKISNQISLITSIVNIFILCLTLVILAMARSVSNRVLFLQESAAKISSRR